MCERSHARYLSAEGRRRSPSGSSAGPSGLGPAGAGTPAPIRLYLTVTVFTAEVLDVPECVTRTRILYLPFFDGAFHLSE
jgi:hypothetical protein